MSEQNSDKLFRDKLNGMEPAYNQADWQQMEAMLDADGKGRRPVAYWWVGAALLLLLGGGAAWYQLGSGNSNNELAGSVVISDEATNDEASASSLYDADCEDAAPAALVDEEDLLAVAEEEAMKAAIETVKSETPASNKTTTNTSAGNGGAIKGENENPIDETATASLEAQSLLYLRIIQPELYSIEQDMAGLDEDASVTDKMKHKRSVVQYSIAAETGIHQSFMQTATFTKPGFSAGVSFEALFKNRVGLYTGVRYTKWIYQVDDPLCEYENCPESVTSRLNAVELPIGIRVIALQKNRWNLYVSTGISNMIVIDERYGYSFNTVVDTSSPPSFPTQGFASDIFLPVGFNSNESITTNDAFDGHGFDPTLASGDVEVIETATKRYIANYQIAVGFEHHFGRAFSWQIEPGYTVTLRKIGLMDERLHTASVNARIRYYFGR